MADISGVVDEVRGFLLSYDQRMSDRLSELATTYAGLCVDANRRLAKCQRLLQQGLRAEAIHLAKEPPDLLDSIQALDFAERPLWIEIVRQYDLPPPPELDATAIEFLHSAYVEDTPLRDILRLHRRLALQRAPLTRRLHVLRELAEKDPNSPIWPADIQVFEAARVDQIKVAALEAKRLQDVVALGLLNDELSSKSWATPPPKALSRDVAQTLSNLRSLRKRQGQVELIAELHDAFAARDADKGREIRTRWRSMDGEGNPYDNPMYKQVEPVFLWLDEADREEEEEYRYHQSVADLEQSLEEETAPGDLEQSRERIIQAGRGIPDELDRKYRERIEHFSRQAARKRRIIVASAGSLLAVSLVVAFLVQRRVAEDASARSVAAELGKYLDEGRLPDALSLLDKLKAERPQLPGHPALAAALSRIVEAEADEAKRSAAFENVYLRADQAPVDEKEPESLADARKLAVTADEKRRVGRLVDRRHQDYRDALARIDAEARPKLDGLAETISRLETLLAARESEPQVREKLRETSNGLRDLGSQIERTSDSTRRRFEEVSSRSEKIRAELKQREIVQEAEQSMTRALGDLPGNPEGYEKALTESISQLGDSPRSADLSQVLADKPAWAAGLALSDFARHARPAPNGADTSSGALLKVAAAEKLLTDFPQTPDRALVEELREHFRAISLRTEGENSLGTQIGNLFDEHAIGNVFITTVEDVRGERHYYSKAPLNETSRMLVWLGGYKAHEIHKDYIGKEILRSPPKLEAPHSKLAASLKASLARRKELEGWDSMMLGFMKEIAEGAGVDPILKHVMIGHLSRLAGEGSRQLAVAIEPLVSEVKRAGVRDSLHWMDPNDADARAARPYAEAFLRKLTPLWPEMAKRAEAAHHALGERFARVPQPVGWLIKDGKWACRQISTPLPTAFEVCVASGTSRVEWEVIGGYRDQTLSFLPLKTGRLTEGKLVFWRPKDASGGSPEKH